MSNKELAIETKNYVKNALKKSQESHHGQCWCHRDPKKWALVAQHIILPVGSVSEFIRKNGVARNLYYDIKAELMADPECQAVRDAWGSEVASLTFHGLDTHRTIMDKFSSAIDSGEIEVDENVVFKSVKGLQGLTDIHGKLTGTNVQKHEVVHVVTQDDYDAKKQELMDRIKKAKEAKKVEEDIIEA